MANTTPGKEELAARAAIISEEIRAAEAAVEEKRRESVTVMKEMRDLGMSWAAVGAAFGVTPQAAMYATGSSVRTPKRGHSPS